MLNKKVHVLVFYTLLNWKMHGETVKYLFKIWAFLSCDLNEKNNHVSGNEANTSTCL